uniref:Leptin n=1 Tax=Hucho hucho TaxID=62062 RepID=A0A4W5QWS0_9TELE
MSQLPSAIREDLMEPGSDTHRPSETTDMDCSMALLVSSLLALFSMGAGASLSLDIVRTKVKILAQTMVYRTQMEIKKLPSTSNLVIDGLELFFPAAAGDQPIEGLPSIVETMGFYQDLLISLDMADLKQLVEDASTMRDQLENWMMSRCPGCQQKQTGEGGLEEALKDNVRKFGLSVSPVALNRLKGYLDRLLLNLDQLRYC